MLTAEQLKTELSQFNGTENYYKHSLGFSYTDGINFLAENAECYWLLDAIGSYQHKLRLNPMLRDFQLWLLVVGDSHEFIKPETESMAVLTCWEDTPVLGVKPAVSQQIPFTDFPMSEIKIYLENKVLLLPDER
jgi:hypothetical protein